MIRKAISLYVFILVISAFVPWELMVTRFNITHAENKGTRPDLHYLLSLDGNNLHLIQDYAGQHQLAKDSIYYSRLDLEHKIDEYQYRVVQQDFRSLVLMEQWSFSQLNSELP